MLNAREQIWGVSPARRRKGQRRGTTKPVVGEQRSLAHVRTWGGPRPGSGRTAAERANVRHRLRPVLEGRFPVHATLRRAKGLPSFRSERVRRLLEQAIADTKRDGFRIVHYSLQHDHVHLIVEATNATVLTNAMRSFAVRVAMRLNRRIFARTCGRIWGDRYHREDLTSPSQVRNTLVYVLANHLKHEVNDVGLLDPCSSGPWWDGWLHILDPPSAPSPVQHPTTWLLRRGWRGTTGFGFIHLGERPRPARRRCSHSAAK
jgi:putative transposase